MENNHKTMLKWIDDDELDELIRASAERHELLNDIQYEVMNKVHCYSRRETMHRWIRMLAFAFGLPMAVFCFGAGVYILCTATSMSGPLLISVVISAVAVLALIGRTVRNFSISDV